MTVIERENLRYHHSALAQGRRMLEEQLVSSPLTDTTVLWGTAEVICICGEPYNFHEIDRKGAPRREDCPQFRASQYRVERHAYLSVDL